MKNINLRKSLLELHKNNLNKKLVIGNRKYLTINKLNIGVRSNKNWKAIVCCKNTINLIHILTSVDGIAEVICPINYLMSEKDKDAILKQYNFTHLITDITGKTLNIFKTFGLKIIKYKKIEFKKIKFYESAGTKTAWLVPTSGTSALPKLVKHTLQTLAKNVKNKPNENKQSQVWGMLYDITRYAGYQVFFQSLLTGGKLIITNADEPLKKKIDRFIKNKVSCISATPTLWRKILMYPESKKLNLNKIILGGEPADQNILDALLKTYKFAKITHVYASTEAGVTFSVSDVKPGFPLSFIKNSKNNIKIKVKNKHLYIKSPGTALSYLRSNKLFDKNGWIKTGDIIKIQGKRFFVTGRESGILNVGGDKVLPEEIRRVLLECNIVQDAVVYGKKNPFIGYLINADIQLKKNKEKHQAKRELKFYINKNLLKNQRPQIINFLSSVNTDNSGKARIR